MKTIRSVISLLFGSVNPQEVLDNLFADNPKDLSVDTDISHIISLFEANYRNYSHDEAVSIMNVLKSSWSSYNDKLSESNGLKSVFYTIQNFISEILLEKDGIPQCEFQQLLRWREMSFELGENIFTTSFLAYKDLPSKRNRHFFSWQSTIRTNNTILHDILSQGCSELHFHLWGSSQNFDINWLCLMNNIYGRSAEFSQLMKLKHSQIVTRDNQPNYNLYFLYVKAFALRLLLFKLFINKHFIDETISPNSTTMSFTDYIEVLRIRDSRLLSVYISKLQSEIEWIKDFYGRKNRGKCIDYAIPKNISEVNFKSEFVHNLFHYGERWIMYKAFSIIYKNEERASIIQPLFYTYLIIQNRFRKEFIQLNNNTGFRNFQEYQDRKDLFIDKYEQYKELLANIAINSVLNEGIVKHFEVRIAPKNSPKEITDTINKIDSWVSYTPFVDDTISNYIVSKNKYNSLDSFHYVLHFIKKDETLTSNNYLLNLKQCRSFLLRNNIKKQTFSITKIRKTDTYIKSRIIGIDAASSEIGCRPEVFAQAYRYLKNYSYETSNYAVSSYQFKQLGYTYHVGEDFLDIVDGLRAIDESIVFLNLSRGDRLGHALALGTDVEKYYYRRENKIIISNQNLLDNIVWMLIYCKKNNIDIPSKIEHEINYLYHNLLNEIYNGYISHTNTQSEKQVCKDALSKSSSILDVNEMNRLMNNFDQNISSPNTPTHSIPIDTYYQSWLLRGDNPELYVTGCDINNISFLSFWDRCGMNYISNEILDARKNSLARDLYIAYHYDPIAKGNGEKIREYSVSKEYMLCVSEIQRKMRNYISKNHISIECNPTSNKLIGCISKYEEHPITLFSNLEYSNGNIFNFECNHISVSINTDDLGVFATSIENEYALLAIAMEKKLEKENLKEYSRRMIYDWLNRIRILGLEQRFNK